ncbi:hypothetical protein Clacol_003372 [Clathrus columnatus]|uniref:Uncharacterized protein n=1 Tax=Clathrus columnatus TaxID=1419009 RepID=A0AAV5A4E7_9AGAM|nr:hypothetical protein Clacol_003372 [Clathrus columnatus]
MTVTFYHFVFDENVWNESPLAYNWFPLPPSKPATLPAVPPKDTDRNMALNPPMNDDSPPSIDIEIASIEPPPPSAQNGHRRQISSWLPTPRDPESKARTLAAARLLRGDPPEVASRPSDPTEVFEDIPINQLPRLPEPEMAPKFSLNEYISRLSFGGPQWAKKLRAAKRGVDLPFPVAAKGPTKRYSIRVVDPPGTRGIDAPVSPASFRE